MTMLSKPFIQSFQSWFNFCWLLCFQRMNQNDIWIIFTEDIWIYDASRRFEWKSSSKIPIRLLFGRESNDFVKLFHMCFFLNIRLLLVWREYCCVFIFNFEDCEFDRIWSKWTEKMRIYCLQTFQSWLLRLLAMSPIIVANSLLKGW